MSISNDVKKSWMQAQKNPPATRTTRRMEQRHRITFAQISTPGCPKFGTQFAQNDARVAQKSVHNLSKRMMKLYKEKDA